MWQVTLPVRVGRRLGAETLIVTNAAGGINRSFEVADLMLISDHVNFLGMAGVNPLIGPNLDSFGTRFPEMTTAYDAELRALAKRVAAENQVPLQEGVYFGLSGPAFETPAELRFLRAVGADAVGMSTVNEVLVARHSGMKVLGFSGITNTARLSPDEGEPPSHEEVTTASVVCWHRWQNRIYLTQLRNQNGSRRSEYRSAAGSFTDCLRSRSGYFSVRRPDVPA
jgi:purine-nucleoside phosphorylase